MDELEMILDRFNKFSERGNEEKKETCPMCNGTFWVTEKDENGYIVAKRCSCFTEERKRRRKKYTNIPISYENATLENFKTDIYETDKAKKNIAIIKQVVKQYLNNFDEYKNSGKGFYLSSSCKGSGKTRFVCSILNELMRDDIKCKFITSTQILQEIRNSWDKKSEYSESQLLDQLYTCDVLAIDDFGTENVKDWTQEKFYNIVNERYVNKKITLFTSNYTLQELDSIYDDRITNRIKEMCFNLVFPNESIRNYINQENVKELTRILRNNFAQ